MPSSDFIFGLSEGLSEAGAFEFLAEVRAVYFDDAAHLLKAGAHTFADAIAKSLFAGGRTGRRDRG